MHRAVNELLGLVAKYEFYTPYMSTSCWLLYKEDISIKLTITAYQMCIQLL